MAGARSIGHPSPCLWLGCPEQELTLRCWGRDALPLPAALPSAGPWLLPERPLGAELCLGCRKDGDGPGRGGQTAFTHGTQVTPLGGRSDPRPLLGWKLGARGLTLPRPDPYPEPSLSPAQRRGLL